MKASSLVKPANYVDLNRAFSPVSRDSGAEDSALQNYSSGLDWQMRRSALTWKNILERSLVVVLGEPGSGKTYEFREQASRSSINCPRFYLRLDELAVIGHQFELLADEEQRLSDWKSSDKKALFFLDSVDEAKIQQATDFHRALDRFVDLVGAVAIRRANIVISSRITEWLPTTDGHALQIRFPKGIKTSTDAEKKHGVKDEPICRSVATFRRSGG